MDKISRVGTILATLFLILALTVEIRSDGPDLSPAPWPDKFHALLYMNLSDGRLQITNLWYDWARGRNLNLIQKQLGAVLHDVEWDNGTSYYYTLGPTDEETCRTRRFPVGIPRRDWMAGSSYLGRRNTDGFLCHLWEKVDFIWYYEDVQTRRPVRWDFLDGISTHVMTFEVGAELEDSQWQAPSYCFTGNNGSAAAASNEEYNSRQNTKNDGQRDDDVNRFTDHSLRKLALLSSE